MIRTREELSPLEELSLIDISYSRLNTLDFCSAKYFYTYVLLEERTFGAAATLGNVIHSALEETEWDKPLSLSELNTLYRERRVDYDPDRQIDDQLIDAGYRMLSEFVDRHKDDKFDVISTEQPFHFILGNAAISGYIDRIDRGPDGTIMVIDYKSGKNEVAAKHIANDLQLGVYALAVSLLYPEEDKIYAELYYLRSGRRKGHLFTREDLAIVERNLLEKISDLIETDDFKYTPNSRICSFCDFRKICPVGQKRYPNS